MSEGNPDKMAGNKVGGSVTGNNGKGGKRRLEWDKMVTINLSKHFKEAEKGDGTLLALASYDSGEEYNNDLERCSACSWPKRIYTLRRQPPKTPQTHGVWIWLMQCCNPNCCEIPKIEDFETVELGLNEFENCSPIDLSKGVEHVVNDPNIAHGKELYSENQCLSLDCDKLLTDFQRRRKFLEFHAKQVEESQNLLWKIYKKGTSKAGTLSIDETSLNPESTRPLS